MVWWMEGCKRKRGMKKRESRDTWWRFSIKLPRAMWYNLPSHPSNWSKFSKNHILSVVWFFFFKKAMFCLAEYQDNTHMHEKKGQPRSRWPIWWILLATCSTSASLFFLPDTLLYIRYPYNRIQWKPTPFVVQEEILACLSQSWHPPYQGWF